MKLLHTSDWHVGKAIRGHSRAGEHRDALAEIAAVAGDHAVDLVVVAGDLFDSGAPTAESERIVYDALLALAEAAPVTVIAGNHDSGRRLDAVSRLLALGRVTMCTTARPPDDGGVISSEAADGTPVRTALLPFVSQRGIVRAGALMANAGYENAQSYAQRMRNVIGALCAPFGSDTVNLLVGHLFVTGGAAGGGERAAHLIDEYAVSAVDFPASASYVALGHLHRPQVIRGATAIHYCGSPLQLDFGEQDQAKQVNVVELEPGLPAKVSTVPLTAGRPLKTLTGTVAELASLVEDDGGPGEAWLRVRLTEAPRAGLADEVRELLGDAVVDVAIDHQREPRPTRSRRPDGRTPREQFADYLAERGVVDPRLQQTFDALHDEIVSGPEDPETDPVGPPEQLVLGP